MRRRALLALAPLAACAEGLAPVETASLPPGSVEGAGDPTRAAVSRAAFFFAGPARPPGAPAAARAVADMEYLAANLPFDPRWADRDPLLPVRLRQARAEWRQALAIPPDTPPQAMINRLWRIFEGNADDPALLARLAALPPLPRTAEAANAAAQAQARPDRFRAPGLRL